MKESTFYTRADKVFYEKLARKYSKPGELQDFLVANMRLDPKIWVRELCSREAQAAYDEYRKITESYSYVFASTLALIRDTHGEKPFDALFVSTSGEKPPLLILHLQGDVSLEVLIGIDIVTNCFAHWNRAITEPIIWETIHARASRLAPFLKLNPVKLKGIMRKEFMT